MWRWTSAALSVWNGRAIFFTSARSVPKKNLGRVVEAFLASGARCPLVVIGGRGWLGEDELALLQQFRREASDNAQKSDSMSMYLTT